MRTGRKAIIALVLAMMLALPLVGSALAKEILVDDLEGIQDAISEPAEDSERQENHGWYVSQLASDFNTFVDEGDLEGLNRGKWISAFSRWLKTGELPSVLMDKAEARAAKKAAQEEKREARLAAAGQGEDEEEEDVEEDETNEESGRENAPGQAKKDAAAADSDLNPGQAKKAERAGN